MVGAGPAGAELARLLALNAQRAEEERQAGAAAADAADAALAEGKAEYRVKGTKRGRKTRKPEAGHETPKGLFDQ